MGIFDRVLALFTPSPVAAPTAVPAPAPAAPVRKGFRAGVDAPGFLGAAQLRSMLSGGMADPRLARTWRERNPYDDVQLEALGRNGFVRRIITLRAFEATREGWLAKFSSLKPGEAARANARLTSMQRELKARQKLRLALMRKEQYGHSIIVMGADDGEKDWSKPLRSEKVRRVHWLKVFWRPEYMPGPISDATSPNAGFPEYYDIYDFDRPEVEAFRYATGARAVLQKRIHWTRILGPFTTEDGHSRIDEIAEAIEDFFDTHDSASRFASTLAIGIYRIKGWLTSTAQDEQASRGRIAAQQVALSMLNALVLDQVDEDFDWKGRPVNGLGDLLDRKSGFVAAFTGYPLMILLGIDPAGFSTGKEIVEHHHDNCRAVQTDDLEPAIRRLYSLLMRCEDGPRDIRVEPDSWDIYFNPLRRLTPEEMIDLRTKVWKGAADLLEVDLIDREEARTSLFSDQSEIVPLIQLAAEERAETRAQTLEVGTIQAVAALMNEAYPSGAPIEALRAFLQGAVPQMASLSERIFPEPAEPSPEGEPSAEDGKPRDRWITAEEIAEAFGSVTAEQLKAKRASQPRVPEAGKLTWTRSGAKPLYRLSEVRAMFDELGPDLEAGTGDEKSPGSGLSSETLPP